MIRKALRILAADGPLVLRRRAGRYARRRLTPRSAIALAVSEQDLLAADWSVRGANDHRAAGEPPTTWNVTWVIPPIAQGAGGHHTIMRFVRALEDRGHMCTLAIYDARGIQGDDEAQAIIRRHFPAMRARVSSDPAGLATCDVLVATTWQTAYSVYNADTPAMKFYFVQDFEPWFHPVGTESVLAENSYRFGLHGITAGRWLATKLPAEYGMPCDHFDFGSDPDRYRLARRGARRKVVFYARPETPRRGFELGVLALTLFAREHPDHEIHLVGSHAGGRGRLPFPHVDAGILTPQRLDALYNESAAALVISLTNMSLLPLELLSSGCIPVVNDAESNRAVSDNPYIAYTAASPQALARRLGQVVTRPDLPDYAETAAASVQTLSWGVAEERFVDLLRLRLREPHAGSPRESGPPHRSSGACPTSRDPSSQPA